MALKPKKQAKVQATLQGRVDAGTAGAKDKARLAGFTGQATPPPATGGGVKAPPTAPRKGSNFKLGTTLEELNAQKSSLKGKNRLGMVDQAIAGLQPQQQAPTPETAPTVSTGTPEAVTNVQDPQNEALFPSMRAMEPANYQGSPLFDFQQKQGEKRLRATLAKRGLLDSGAEIEAIGDFNTQLGAMEADKARGYAQNEADRLERIQQNEAGRLERGEQRAGDDRFRWTQLGLDQNPMKYAYQGTENYAQNVGNNSNAIASYLADAYQRSSGGGGGGGGQPFVAPFPGSPDFSAIDALGARTGGENNNNYWNSIMKFVGGLF